jgi:uncharacterized membrane protein
MVQLMERRVPCAVCGNLTTRLLFRNKKLSIHVCSKKCEHLYLKNLSQNSQEHTQIVQYFDDRIKTYKVRNRIGWGISGGAVLLLLLGVLMPEVNVFLVGAATVSVSSLATRHYEDRMRKLTIQRKRLAI